MQLSSLLILSLVLSAPENIKITLLDEGLSYSRLHSEFVKYEEGIPFRGNARDKAGNYYFVETDKQIENGVDSRIKRRTPSGEETVFASLKSSPGYEAEFESLFFDPSGNLVLTVVSRKRGAEWLPTRDYYRVEGLPKSYALFRTAAILVFAVFLLILSLMMLVRALYRRRRENQISWLT